MSADTAKPNVALIGCGDISRAHLTSYQNIGLKCVAMCDVDLKRAERRKQQFGVADAEIYTDYHQMLKRDDVDLVTVATPVALHAPMTIAALAAGKHVACEKPSTLSLDENRKIVEASEQAGRKVIFFSSRYRWGPMAMARQYVDDGDIGEIYRIQVQFYRSRGRPGVDIIRDARWFANKELAGGGILMDMGQYFMDCTLDLAGWPTVEAVSATTFKGFAHDLPPDAIYDVEEHASLFVRAGTTTITFDVANISHTQPLRRFMIFGMKGGIVIQGEGFAYYTEKGRPPRQVEHTTAWRDKTRSNDHVYASLVAAIGGDDPGTGTTPKQALAITELTQMAYRSAELGREVARSELA
jgi:predicted dehydrogenase